jgi:flagellar basal body-associated protein FliL
MGKKKTKGMEEIYFIPLVLGLVLVVTVAAFWIHSHVNASENKPVSEPPELIPDVPQDEYVSADTEWVWRKKKQA